MAIASVITADIVNSTKLSKAELKKLIKNLSIVLNGHQYEFFRGDSFQVLVKSTAESLLTLLRARTAVMKLSPESSMPVNDIRASIAIGTVKLPVRSLRTASGEAFTLSGRAFDNMEKDRRLSITCNEENQMIHAGLKVIAYFTDYLFQRLTVKQSAVVYELLINRTQTEIAKKLKKSQATVHKHIQAAGWPEIVELLADYKKMADSVKA
jgi:hypothetical protein